jgi:hypothetical protein
MLAASAGHAEDSVSREAALFDRPLTIERLSPRSASDAAGEILCTYYPDFLVRETATDSPAPGPAALIPLADGGRRPACNAARSAREMRLETADYFLLGRKGPFLVFVAADPSGAVPFTVLDAASGRVIYRDGEQDDGMQLVRLESGRLHLRFTRAFNAACSLLKDGPGCWARLAREGGIPPQLARTPPPVPACAAGYGKGNDPADAPSLITYEVDMTLDRSGKAEFRSFGPVGCDPMP